MTCSPCGPLRPLLLVVRACLRCRRRPSLLKRKLSFCSLVPTRTAVLNIPLPPPEATFLMHIFLFSVSVVRRPLLSVVFSILRGTPTLSIGMDIALPATWLTSMNEGSSLFAVGLMILIICLRPFAPPRRLRLLGANPMPRHLLQPGVWCTGRGMSDIALLGPL